MTKTTMTTMKNLPKKQMWPSDASINLVKYTYEILSYQFGLSQKFNQ